MTETQIHAMEKSPKHAEILGIKLTSTSKERVLDQISQKINKKDKFYIVTPNPEIVLASTQDEELKRILNSADISIPDGIGLKFADPSLTIIKGRELVVDLLELAGEKGWKVYFLGGSVPVNKKAVEIAQKKYTGAKFEGNSGPVLNNYGEPVSEKEKDVEVKAVKDINNFKPNILFVAFGTPKGELWMGRRLSGLKLNCMMQVGGSLDYFTGTAKPVSVFFTSLNLEWLWRLIQEPWRMGRIFNAVVVFPVKVFLSKF